MGASGLIDLKEASLLGFGRYAATQGVTVTNNGQVVQNPFALPTGAQGGQKMFCLIGYLVINDLPPELLIYDFALGAAAPSGGASTFGAQFLFAEASREPIFLMLTPEQPQGMVRVGLRSYALAYLTSYTSYYIDSLVGTVDQLHGLLKWLHGRNAPASLIEQMESTIESALGAPPAGGYY